MNASIDFKVVITQPQNSVGTMSPENIEGTDANGNTIYRDENGFIVIDKNGNRVQEVYTADDGTVITLNYDENGELTFRRDEHADGTWSECNYKDDLLLKEIREFFDGAATIRQETEFYENGNRKLSYTYNLSDSSYTEARYNENGIMIYEYYFLSASEYSENTYYENGKKKTGKWVASDGSGSDTYFNPDGSYYSYDYYPDGSVWYNEYDANHVQNLDAQKQIK